MMKWYAIKYKNGTLEMFRAHGADFDNGVFITFYDAILSDGVAEYYHIAKTEILSIASNLSGEIVKDVET